MLSSRFLSEIETVSETDFLVMGSPSVFSLTGNNLFSPNFDIFPNSDIDAILKNSFKKITYPPELTHTNPFCPYCLKFVPQNISNSTYDCPNFRKKYLAHDECLKKQENSCLNMIVDEINEAKIVPINYVVQNRNISLGQTEYYVEMQLTHPVSGLIFMKLATKLKSNGNSVGWDFKSLPEHQSYFPNIIGLPIPDFQITVSLTKMNQKSQKMKSKCFVNTTKLKINDSIIIKAATDELELILKMVKNNNEKNQLISEMNYKYKYPIDINLPIIQFYRLQVKLPAEDSDEEIENQSRQNSSITQLLNERSSESSAIKSSSFYQKEDRTRLYNSDNLSERSFDKQKVDLSKLIIANKLGDYVRNSNQSRVFQIFLNEASQLDVDEIIKNLYAELPELITHEYANYMIQKLFSLCTMSQRLLITQRLMTQIPNLVQNKQGTHTLQSFVALFTNDQEYRLICDSIRPLFYELSQHSNATHFIQKIIKLLPLNHTINFFNQVNQNFLAYATDKNAMCVIKVMFLRISEGTEAKIKNYALLEERRKNFIRSVIFALNQIIQDCYGNYIIQFCYEMFGEEKCHEITDIIIERFFQFSIQKYSGNVVFKCINNYWTKKQISSYLKSSLNGDSILEMYQNKEGNRVLLAIMEKYENTTLREKIHNQLAMAQPTKFLHDRWGVVMGCRSGTVGTELKCFPEAVKKGGKKRCKYPNNIY